MALMIAQIVCYIKKTEDRKQLCQVHPHKMATINLTVVYDQCDLSTCKIFMKLKLLRTIALTSQKRDPQNYNNQQQNIENQL